ncbi:hypothetical protein C4D60_Mb09t25010 [Musa balbisiana]|uniref:Uncharacterized protein n=1 Tax=Musa balbisiana TaxID=52838 RepID=A0A4S8ILC5_MUSBA|nr:hypothetical protein C4D60_Mb09t25010 [Musa balbisiana]
MPNLCRSFLKLKVLDILSLLFSLFMQAQRELSDPENAIIGAFAGALTGAITTPLDVLKTRLMVQGSANQYKGIISCAQAILKEEGPAAFFKGIGPRVLWIGIGGSIFFGVLERSKLLLSQRHFDQVLKP